MGRLNLRVESQLSWQLQGNALIDRVTDLLSGNTSTPGFGAFAVLLSGITNGSSRKI